MYSLWVEITFSWYGLGFDRLCWHNFLLARIRHSASIIFIDKNLRKKNCWHNLHFWLVCHLLTTQPIFLTWDNIYFVWLLSPGPGTYRKWSRTFPQESTHVYYRLARLLKIASDRWFLAWIQYSVQRMNYALLKFVDIDMFAIYLFVA